MLIRRICLLIIFTLAGCVSLKPAQVMKTEPEYNDVARNVRNEQLLKNIVRIRYSEEAYFLKMTSITTSYSLAESLNASPSLGYTTSGPLTSWSVSRSLGLSPNISYSDSPTLSYMPIEDADFAKQIQTPLTVSQILIPYSSGNYSEMADFVYIARIVLNAMGNYSNAGNLLSNKIMQAPKYKDYYHILDLIFNLWKRGALVIRQSHVINTNVISMQFYKKADSRLPDAIKLKKMLNVPINSDVIYLSDLFNPCAPAAEVNPFSPDSKNNFLFNCKPSKAVHVELRSILEIARFLSFAVDVPECDIRAGYALQVRYSDGRLFDTARLFHGLLRILSSDKEPQDAYIKTYFHHHWFYIQNCDTDSKATFTYLQKLMTLVAGTQGTSQNTVPVLTIPVGR